MRLTPAARNSATGTGPLAGPTTTLTGFGATAFTTARIESMSLRPGAYRTSAPASAKATRRLMVSSRSVMPWRKLSVASGENDTSFRRFRGLLHARDGVVEGMYG